MSSNLHRLADTVGVLTNYINYAFNPPEVQITDDVIAATINRLGFKCDTDEEILHSIDRYNKIRWQKTLDSIYVVEQGDVHFDVVLSSDDVKMQIILTPINVGDAITPKFEITSLGENFKIGKTKYHKIDVKISDKLEVGYYDLLLNLNSEEHKSKLAVAPQECYSNKSVEGKKIWGFAVQLYSLKSSRNWGVGDFTDLLNLVDICKDSGADIIGLNPINVLNHNYPEDASPYASTSRLFLNPIYIDVEAVPEFQKSDIEEEKKLISELNKFELIQYGQIYPLKIKILEKLYNRFREDPEGKRWKEFENFCKDKADTLEKLVLFQALSEEFMGKVEGGWRSWPEDYQNPNSLACSEFAQANLHRLGFFKYLQFEAERQFDLVEERIKKNGLKIGLYRDLAVGVSQDSVEVWGDSEAFIKNAGAGAPPDEFFPNGQSWGLGAFDPYRLKERGYEPFIRVLRANMKNSGALRLDHAMSLMRLFIMLNHKNDGTYVMYNFKDMLNILTIESHLAKCMIVCESLGTVPDGFIEALESKNVDSLSVLWSERYPGSPKFKNSSEYPPKSFASVGTHDMAPLTMWWYGYDIEEKYQLGVIPTKEIRDYSYHDREADRKRLLEVLDRNGCWPCDNLRKSDCLYGEGLPDGLDEAVHSFVSSSPAKVFLAQLEDILHVTKMQNVPGLDRDKHPNWRRKLPINLEDLKSNDLFTRNIKSIKSQR